MTKDYTELVEQAVRGNEESLRKLAEAVHDPLRSYVFRITLKENLTDDIVQETILEMFKILGQLNRADRFLPWLYKIALNKVRSHSKNEKRHNRLLREHAEELMNHSPNLEGLANVINDEIKQVIFMAMSKLSNEQKAVLSMRCYEDMPYSQIAEIMGFTELKSRLLFCRGKKKLQKTLFRYGFKKTALMSALLIFGKLTAPTEAAAAQISITSATLSAGTLAATVSAATSATTMFVATGTIITAGAIAITNQPLNNSQLPIESNQNTTMSVVSDADIVENTAEILEGYYYYPNGSKGPIMTRLSLSQTADQKACKIMQNHNGNFFMSGRTGQVKQNNYHYWNKDLSVMILPTDNPEFLAFLSQVEGRTRQIQTLNRSTNRSLLVVASKQDQTDRISLAIQDYDALMEERFQYNWPAGTAIEDTRDEMHQQGWCYVEMSGSINGQPVDGIGQIPFLYSIAQSKPAWIKMTIGQHEMVDTPKGAAIVNSTTKDTLSYQSGTLLNALNQPWVGLHCIDAIRREAVRKRIYFETSYLEYPTKCSVRLSHESGVLEYIIDMEKDLIKTINFLDLNGGSLGQIQFNYLAPDEIDTSQFRMPYIQNQRAGQTLTEHWLVQLAGSE